MRILKISYEFPPLGGGGGKVVGGLLRELLDRGHTVDLVTMRWPERTAIAALPGLTIHGVPCLRFRPDRCSPLELASYALPALWITRRLLHEKRFDAFHAHFILPDGLVFYLLRGAHLGRFVITAHGSDVPGYNPDRFTVLHRVLRPLWRRIVAAADAVICPSPTLERLVRHHLATARTEVIPNGLEPPPWRDDDALRRRRILVLSRLQPRKGVQHVVEAFTGMATDFELHVGGDGPLLPALEQQAAGDPRIVLHGWIDGDDPRLAELLETSTIFVLLSQAENFPVSLLEAMAAGLAIVTTSGTGCADVVADTALLVEPGDVQGLRAALTRLVGDPELVAKLGRAGRRRLLENFTWDEVAARYVSVYERQAGRVRVGRPVASTASGGTVT